MAYVKRSVGLGEAKRSGGTDGRQNHRGLVDLVEKGSAPPPRRHGSSELPAVPAMFTFDRAIIRQLGSLLRSAVETPSPGPKLALTPSATTPQAEGTSPGA